MKTSIRAHYFDSASEVEFTVLGSIFEFDASLADKLWSVFSDAVAEAEDKYETSIDTSGEDNLSGESYQDLDFVDLDMVDSSKEKIEKKISKVLSLIDKRLIAVGATKL